MQGDFYSYTALSGDTFDSIALDFYNDESFASTLLADNPDYRTTLIFQGGEQLWIRILSDQAPTTLPPWKKSSP